MDNEDIETSALGLGFSIPYVPFRLVMLPRIPVAVHTLETV